MTNSKTKVDLKTLEVSTNEFASLVGKSSRWIRQLTSEGILTQCSRGRYRLSENILAYIGHVEGGRVGDTKQSHADIKAEHEMLKKEKMEIELQQVRSQLHDAETVKFLMNDMIEQVKDKFQSLPKLVSPQLEGETAKGIEKKLKTEIDNALLELVNYSPEQSVAK